MKTEYNKDKPHADIGKSKYRVRPVSYTHLTLPTKA